MIIGIRVRVRVAERGRKEESESEDEDEEGKTNKWIFVLLGLSLRRRFFKLSFFFLFKINIFLMPITYLFNKKGV